MPVTPITDVDTTHTDATGDDPKLMRADLLDLMQKFNTLLDQANALGVMDLGDGLENDAQSAGVRDLLKLKAADASVDISAAGIKVAANAITPAQLQRNANMDWVLASQGTSADAVWKAQSGVPVAIMVPFAGLTAPSGWLFADGSAVSRTTYATLWAALHTESVVSISNATPAVVTWAGHGREEGDAIVFSTTGALPASLVAGTTTYYVKSPVSGSFNISATRGGAALATTSGGSGVHTAWHTPYGAGDNSTTFNLPDPRGRTIAGKDNMNASTPPNRLTAGGSGIYGKNLGAAGGAETHQLTSNEMPAHVHDTDAVSGSGGAAGFSWATAAVAVGGAQNTQSTGGNAAHNNTQPTLIVNYIIKT